ncbi:MAG: hypothetical protein P8Y02_12670 [Deinococcales bacterium]|jgi:hypothetical protein
MRKVLITLLAITALGAGAAFAQNGMGSQYWAGVSAGYPGASVHFGVSDVAPNLSVRANLGYGYAGHGTAGYGFTVGLDGMYNLPVNTGDLPLTVYAGLGPTAGFGYTASSTSSAEFAFGLNAFAGAEYRLGQIGFEPGGVFFEAGPAIYFVPSAWVDFVGRVGFNYHF